VLAKTCGLSAVRKSDLMLVSDQIRVVRLRQGQVKRREGHLGLVLGLVSW